jgi:hypothetical protein
MVSIVAFRWHETDITDVRNITENKIINKIELKTSERVNWTTLRLMRPVPQWSDEHPTEPGFYLDYVRPVHKKRQIWELEAEYTPFKGGQIDPNPTERGAVVTYSTSLVEQATLRDNAGRPIVNRAGEFIRGLMLQVPIVEYKFSKNLPNDPEWLQTHLGAVNSDTITLRGLKWPAKTLLLSSAEGAEFITENRTTYTPTSGTILADIRTWTQEVWNTGTVQLKQVEREMNGEKKKIYIQVPILEGDPPEPITEPVPLDEFGVLIQEALEPSKTEPLKKQNLITLKFDLQPELPFKVLPLQ